MNRLTAAAIIVALILTSTCLADDWPAFRGPNGQGVSDAKSIPVKWTDADYKWKIALPGTGPSSPVIIDGKLFVTCADASAPTGILLALNAETGEQLWRKEYPLPESKMNALNSYATCTPVVTGDSVYVIWSTAAETAVVALDHKGNEIFKKKFGPTYSSHGPGVSPSVAGDLVVFTHEQRTDEPGLWIALDRRSGEQRWTTERDNGQISYSTPCIYQPPGDEAQLIFTSTTHGITAVELTSGKVAWEVKDAFIARVVSSPVIAGDIIIGSCGQGGGGKQIAAVKAPANKSEKPTIVWKSNDRVTTQYVPTGLYKDGLLYTCHDAGTIACRRADTGEILWSEKPAGKFYGSPVWVDGKIYCITREGDCVVFQAGPEYKLLAINSLGEASDATPAIANGKMYLRTKSKLMCLAPTGK
jgi:outer membrane protein assembly factor BamB